MSHLHSEQEYNIEQTIRRTIYETQSVPTPYNQRTTKPSAHQDARYIRRPRQS
jgi:hypothetical protein